MSVSGPIVELRLPSALLCGAVFLLLGFPFSSALAESVYGDLPPCARDKDALLSQAAESRDLPALVKEMHDILLERLGDTGINSDALYLAAMEGMLEAVEAQLNPSEAGSRQGLPPAGMLIPEAEAERLQAMLRGSLVGLGLEFQHRAKQGLLQVTGVVVGAPADLAGIAIGDRVLGTTDVGFAGLGFDAILAALRGPEGTQVALDVVRRHGAGYRRFAVQVRRAAFELPTVQSALVPGGVGLVSIAQFHDKTPDEVLGAIRDLEAQGARRYVLDLRNSSGGDLEAVAGVADLFLPASSVVVRTIEAGVGERDLLARGPVQVGGDLAVLVNRWTYGGAEALAAALQDHSRGYIIGEQTLGEGRVETLIPLRGGLVLRLDSIQLLSPSGRSWHQEGLRPDQLFLGEWNDSTIGLEENRGRDPIFDSAVHYLQTSTPRP